MKIRKLDCRRWLLGFVTVVFLCAGLVCAQEKPEPAFREKQLNIDSFEYLWKTIHENHFDPTFGGVDWKAARLEFRPQIEAARDKNEARTVMRQMLSRLKLTHFSILPSELYEDMNKTGSKSSGGGVTGINVRTLKLIVRPRPEVYAGRVAILVDGLSLCATEVFAGGLRDLGRARIFGSHTGGATLGGMVEKLPNGDGFMYAYANYVTAGGHVLEGNGLAPDIEVKHTREALLQGRDLALEAAVNWIRKQH